MIPGTSQHFNLYLCFTLLSLGRGNCVDLEFLIVLSFLLYWDVIPDRFGFYLNEIIFHAFKIVDGLFAYLLVRRTKISFFHFPFNLLKILMRNFIDFAVQIMKLFLHFKMPSIRFNNVQIELLEGLLCIL